MTNPNSNEPDEYEGHNANPYDLIWVCLLSSILIGLLIALMK